MINKILLFDIDGVLIKPLSYRTAILDSLSYWLGDSFPKVLLPTAAEFDLFESFGMTNEWDMTALCLTVILEKAVAVKELTRITELEGVQTLLKQAVLPAAINYQPRIEAIGQFYQAIGKQFATRREMYAHQTLRTIFPTLYGTPLYRRLLLDLDDIRESAIIQVFQNFILGNDLYQQTYQLTPAITSASYLIEQDFRLISDQHLMTLKSWREQGQFGIAMMTARASRPIVIGKEKFHTWYAPEADLAMQLLDLPEVPVIGSGHMAYTARNIECNARQLLKPAPFHALSAILAAFGIPVISALSYAVGLMDASGCGELKADRRVPEELKRYIPEKFEVHVVEDSWNLSERQLKF